MIQTNDQLRLARVEAVCDQLRSEMDDVMQRAYDSAVAAQNGEQAAEIARKIRNKRLDESDRQCTFDKILPTAPSGMAIADWLDWLKRLAEAANGAWGAYRKALRDLPEQAGFPFEIDWPEAPDAQANKTSRTDG